MVRAYQLRIDGHEVHRIDGEELVISILKDITLTVVIVDELEQILTSAIFCGPLTASLLYENGHPVEQIGRHQPAMKGGASHMTHGTATFKLRVNALSSLRQNQRFRVLVTGMSTEQGKLEVITHAMRTIAKLPREPSEQSAKPVKPQITDRATESAVAQPAAPPGQTSEVDGEGMQLKRKPVQMSHLLAMITDHDRSIGELRESQQAIMSELKTISDTARRGRQED